MNITTPELPGHDILELERFMDTTRHMIVFDVLTWDSPVGRKGETMRLFLSETGYNQALDAQRCRQIKIRKHADVIEGHVLYDRKKSRVRR